MTNSTIRIANSSDLPTIQQLGFELLEYERRNWDSALDPNWPFSETGKAKYLEAINEKYVLLAEIDSKAVGYLIGKIIKPQAESARSIIQARLENIFVKENYQKSGIGSALFNNFKSYCIKQNVSRLDVSVLAKNKKAISFYQKVGFEPRSLNLSQELK